MKTFPRDSRVQRECEGEAIELSWSRVLSGRDEEDSERYERIFAICWWRMCKNKSTCRTRGALEHRMTDVSDFARVLIAGNVDNIPAVEGYRESAVNPPPLCLSVCLRVSCRDKWSYFWRFSRWKSTLRGKLGETPLYRRSTGKFLWESSDSKVRDPLECRVKSRRVWAPVRLLNSESDYDAESQRASRNG